MSARAWFGWAGAGVAGLVLVLGATDGATVTPSPSDHAAATAIPVAPAGPSTPAATRSTETTNPTAPATRPAHPASALAAVDGLSVKGRAPRTGYSRQQFGRVWFDADRNGCDTRNDILRRDLVDRQMKNWCKVLAGTRSPDPYTGRTIRFVIGGPSEVDVDHVVALADAWQKGAASWPPGIREQFANDPLALLAVDAGTNRSKGDGDAATWLPPNRSYRCAYVARQVAVKAKYRLWVTAAERDAMVRVLSTCPRMPLPR